MYTEVITVSDTIFEWLEKICTLKMFWRKSFTHDQKVWSIGHILDDKIKLWPITQLMKKKTVLLVFSVLDHYLIALFWFLIATLYNTKRSKGKLI